MRIEVSRTGGRPPRARRLRSACSRARACTSLTCTSLTSHRARARRPRRLVSGSWGGTIPGDLGLSTRPEDDSRSSSTTRRALATAAGQPYGPPREGPRTSPGLPSAGRPNLGGPGRGFRLPAGRARGWSLSLPAAVGGVGCGRGPALPASSLSSEPGSNRPTCHRNPESPVIRKSEIVEFWVPVGIGTKS